MKTLTRRAADTMSHDAYAGFLKLWLTPPTLTPRHSREVDAYLRYATERDPLPQTLALPQDETANRAA